MPKTPNHECKNCHKMYYACNAALTAGNAWKSACCSLECYREYQKALMKTTKIMPTKNAKKVATKKASDEKKVENVVMENDEKAVSGIAKSAQDEE